MVSVEIVSCRDPVTQLWRALREASWEGIVKIDVPLVDRRAYPRVPDVGGKLETRMLMLKEHPKQESSRTSVITGLWLIM